MAEIRISANVPDDLVGGLLRVVANPFGGERGRRVVELIRADIDEEFGASVFHRPGGGSTPWKARVPFGQPVASGPLLGGRGGRLARAWAGGSGGFSRVKPTTVEVGVRGIPGAAAHRGGSGTRVDPSKVTTIRPRKAGARGMPAMFWFLGMNKAVWLSEATLRRGLRLPARPHAGGNPRLGKEIARALSLAIAAEFDR